MNQKYLSVVIRLMLLFSWSPVVVAGVVVATSPEVQETLNVPAVLLIVAFLLSTLAGGSALAVRINAQLYANPDKAIPFPKTFCFAHMMGSYAAGAAFFLLSQHQRAGLWTTLLMVFVASFIGAKAVEMLAEKLLPMRPNQDAMKDQP